MTVKALFEYTAEKEDELSFAVGGSFFACSKSSLFVSVYLFACACSVLSDLIFFLLVFSFGLLVYFPFYSRRD